MWWDFARFLRAKNVVLVRFVRGSRLPPFQFVCVGVSWSDPWFKVLICHRRNFYAHRKCSPSSELNDAVCHLPPLPLLLFRRRWSWFLQASSSPTEPALHRLHLLRFSDLGSMTVDLIHAGEGDDGDLTVGDVLADPDVLVPREGLCRGWVRGGGGGGMNEGVTGVDNVDG